MKRIPGSPRVRVRHCAPRLAGVVALVLLGMIPAGRTVHAQVPRVESGADLKELRASIPRLLEEHGVSGLAVGVVEDGQVLFTAGYGCADCESGRPVTDSTLFNLASVSKSVTAWGLMHLAETQDLDLDASLASQVHQSPIPLSVGGGVSLRQLLSHTAGLSMPSVPEFPADSLLPTRESVLRGQAGDHGPIEYIHEPGSRWSYSGGGYLLLELILEEISGQPFPDYLAIQIFRPLGMEETTFDVDAVSSTRVAVPYDDNGDPIEPYRLVGVAAGGLYSSARDFTRFVAAYADGPGTQAGGGVLSPEAVFSMFDPTTRVVLPDVETGSSMYGLGHNVHESSTGGRMVFHSGGNPGFLAYFLVLPETGNGLVLMSNSSRAVPVLARILELWADHYRVELPPLY